MHRSDAYEQSNKSHRNTSEVFRLHRVEYKGQAHEFRVHRHDRRLPESASEAGREVRKAQDYQGFAALNESVRNL